MNYENANRLTHSFILQENDWHSLASTFEYTLEYYENSSRASRSNTGTLLHLFTAIDRVGSFQNALDWNANNVHGTFGFLAFITTLLIGLTAMEPVRRKLWELFYFSHVMLVPLVFLFTFLHVRKRTAQVIMLVPILMYVLDCLIRGLFMLSRRSSAKSATAKPLGKLATRIEVDTKFPCGFEAGQYVVFDFNTHSIIHSLTHSLTKNTNTNSQTQVLLAQHSRDITVRVASVHDCIFSFLKQSRILLWWHTSRGIVHEPSSNCLAEPETHGQFGRSSR